MNGDEENVIAAFAYGEVTHAPGTGFIVVVVDNITDAEAVREAIADKLADNRGVIVEEVRYVTE